MIYAAVTVAAEGGRFADAQSDPPSAATHVNRFLNWNTVQSIRLYITGK